MFTSVRTFNEAGRDGRRGLLFAAITAVIGLLVAVLVNATPAKAGVDHDSILRSWATGVCVDSNYSGAAYAIGCNGGNYQNWFIGGTGVWVGSTPVEVLRSDETNRCLDSNASGSVYTSPCQGGNHYQYWLGYGTSTVAQFRDLATGLCLQTNGDGRLFTTACGSNFQDWREGY